MTESKLDKYLSQELTS